jgi:hypothetical protein
MRKPRVFFRLMRRAWRRWLMPPSETRAISSIDAREFSDLLVSGRTRDLKILADRLSQHARASQGKVPVKPLDQHGSNSKGSGIAK